MNHLDPITKKNVDLWLTGSYDQKTKEEIQRLMRENPNELTDAFYTHLSFGTGGMRGIMGVGPNRMNCYTVGAVTQGFANQLKKESPQASHSILLGFDSRHHSQSFAEEAAKILAGNGIKAYLFKDLRPTPLVSYGCRLKKCSGAIMITASHNPPKYNGYKVYGSDGGQLLSSQANGILAEMEKITDPSKITKVDSLSHPLIQLIEEEIDEQYLKETSELQLYQEENRQSGESLKVVYTSLYGTGITLAPKELKLWGFTNISYVDEQIVPNGDFPTTPFPNPEEKSALKLGIEKLEKTKADLLIATDPDADRVGVVVNHHGKPHILTGNQIACVCLYHICNALTSQGKMPTKAAFIKTIATTELFQTICDAFHKPCFNVLIGFKYVAEKILEWENTPNGYEYIFGAEESYGYLLGSLTRDKDAIVASALICETAFHAKKQGKTLIDLLHDLFRKYGVYTDNLLSVKFDESKVDKEKMDQGMARLRKDPLQAILGVDVQTIEDYQSSKKVNLMTGQSEQILLPKSNILTFWLADGTKLMIRPSGTEPKIKLYCGMVQKRYASLEEAIQNGQKQSSLLLETFAKLAFEK